MKTATILIAYTLILIGILTVIAVYLPKPSPAVENKNFVGVDATGFKHGSGANSTIINH